MCLCVLVCSCVGVCVCMNACICTCVHADVQVFKCKCSIGWSGLSRPGSRCRGTSVTGSAAALTGSSFQPFDCSSASGALLQGGGVTAEPACQRGGPCDAGQPGRCRLVGTWMAAKTAVRAVVPQFSCHRDEVLTTSVPSISTWTRMQVGTRRGCQDFHPSAGSACQHGGPCDGDPGRHRLVGTGRDSTGRRPCCRNAVAAVARWWLLRLRRLQHGHGSRWRPGEDAEDTPLSEVCLPARQALRRRPARPAPGGQHWEWQQRLPSVAPSAPSTTKWTRMQVGTRRGCRGVPQRSGACLPVRRALRRRPASGKGRGSTGSRP
jgi:hypothetical protein